MYMCDSYAILNFVEQFTNQEESKDLVASLWYQTASYAGNQTEGLKSYRNAIQLLQVTHLLISIMEN